MGGGTVSPGEGRGGPGLEGFLKGFETPLVVILISYTPPISKKFDAIKCKQERKEERGKKKREMSFGMNSAMCKNSGPNSKEAKFANADLEVKQLVGCI